MPRAADPCTRTPARADRGPADAQPLRRVRRGRHGIPRAHLAPTHAAGGPRRQPTGRDWQGLTVLATADGREDDSVGEVEFEAAHDGGVLHERSRFIRRAGRWVYVDGDVIDHRGRRG